MRVAIVGSRTFNDYEQFCATLEKYAGKISHVVSGGAPGADTLATQYAVDNNIAYTVYHANWEIGKHAGFVRNQLIVDNADRIIAFWDMRSKGTKDTIERAKRAMKPVDIININANQLELPFEDQ